MVGRAALRHDDASPREASCQRAPFQTVEKLSGLPVRELLVASHIVPWSDFPNERLNPQNGLCLSRLHDGAFDAGLIAFDGERKLVMSNRLKKLLPHAAVQQNFEGFAGTTFALPEDAPEPSADFLRYHRERVFN